jgi:hypothetical protein
MKEPVPLSRPLCQHLNAPQPPPSYACNALGNAGALLRCAAEVLAPADEVPDRMYGDHF